ncbi:diguanylate cyclase [Neiella sp. HB171785]|uniref:diguanylate cyclase n=1 Tax=Neiella litorisoli TaxID=2771431 RepID=A0A8J6QHA1_9GAMM|nr:diguanylate cyclase [Neiella litorisoli]MBD1388373.1 diguanylate cyclase [Neiella litorisoli]
MKSVVCLLLVVLMVSPMTYAERSVHSIEKELKHIILGEYAENEAKSRRQQIAPLIAGVRKRAQFLFELSECGIQSNLLTKDWIRRSTELIKRAKSWGSKELEMFARYCRSYAHTIHDDIDRVLEDSNLIAQWSEQNLPAYRTLAFANRIRLLAFVRSSATIAPDSYRDFIIAQSLAETPNQLAEVKTGLADLMIHLRDLSEAEVLLADAKALLTDVTADWIKGDFHIVKSYYHRQLEQHEQALKDAQTATELYHQSGISYGESAGLIAQIINLSELGRLSEALTLIETIPEHNTFLSGARRDPYLSMAFAHIYSGNGQPDKAIGYAKTAYEAFAKVDSSSYRVTSTLRYAELLAETQQWQRATRMFQEYAELSNTYTQRIKSQYSDMSSTRLNLEKQQHKEQQAELKAQLQEQTIANLKQAQQWQVMAIAASITLFLVMTAATIVVRQRASRMTQMIGRDQLTQLPNRRSITVQLARALKASDSLNPTSIALFDIDHLSQINEDFGHSAGDQLLQEVAQQAQQLLAGRADIGRFDGDEFLLICAGRGKQETEQLCHQLKATLSELALQHIGIDHQLSLSGGIATASGSNTPSSVLLTRANDALKLAKQKGRDRIESSAF